MTNNWFSTKSYSKYVKEISKSDWNNVKNYTIREIRTALNEGELLQEQYEELIKLICKKFDKESYEL